MNNKKYSPMDIIISVILVIWFIASIAVMIFFGKTGRGGLVPAVLGQYFLVFGIAGIISGIKNKKVNPITFVFPVVGLICIIATLILYFGAENAQKTAFMLASNVTFPHCRNYSRYRCHFKIFRKKKTLFIYDYGKMR